MMPNTNPFENVNDTASGSHGRSEERRGNASDKKMASSPSSSLFPGWMSSWMATPRSRGEEDDDDSLYHDCIMDDISSSSSMEDETTSLLPKTALNQSITSQSLSPLHQRPKFYNATASPTPVRSNSSPIQHRRRHNGDATNANNLNSNVGRDITINTTLQHEEQQPHPRQSIGSPFAQALATWLSPYADSAKSAGRKILHFSEIIDEDTESCDEGESRSNLRTRSDHDSANATTTGETINKVRFHSDYKDAGNDIESPNKGRRSNNLGSLTRVSSSPALMTAYSDETWNNNAVGDTNNRFGAASANTDYSSTIVLKDIDVQGENNDSDDSTVIHPWTKLILLEELGTAWSWFVLLLPYAFMILAIILDGDSTLKNTTVGPLRGKRTCADMVQGFVPTFDASVKGYFPVPFRFIADGNNRTKPLDGSCTYPFELREGVGLLSHGGKNAASNLTLSSSTTSSSMATARTTIIDIRYRYLMSHGHAFTSGVISNVPPTSLSLRGSVEFINLSSAAVALVARGSVLASTIVFQRPIPNYEDQAGGNNGNESAAYTNPTEKQEWSPVLILSSKRLDMVCKLNHHKKAEYDKSTTWNCSRRIIDAFFSLPNTAVLMGGDLRVDILLSHHNTHKSTGDRWFYERGGIMNADDDYIINDMKDNVDLSEADTILSSADVSHPQDLLRELSTKSVYKLEHESAAYNNFVEATRIFSLLVTLVFTVSWCWSMGIMNEDSDNRVTIEEGPATTGGILAPVYKLFRSLSHIWERNNLQTYRFWWQDPWITFPERRYLLWLLFCLIMLQNPLLAYAYFHPSLYSSALYRFAADSLSGISVHGILFLWLCLAHGLRYHTADIGRRRFDQHRRVLELKKATRHISPTNEIEDNQWGRVRWYYQQYGDYHGVGTAHSNAIIMKHDVNSDSFVEFLVPKLSLLVIGTVASITAAASRFPMSESSSMSEREELNPDRFGSGSKIYVISCIVQIIVIQIWCLFILYTSFVTGERLRREPFLSTRPAQLAFRVLSGILLLGLGFSLSLFYFHSLHPLHLTKDSPHGMAVGNEVSYDTSVGGNGESWDSKADILLNIIRRATTEIPYVGTSQSIGPGKILYATACSLVIAHIFLPSSHFHPSKKEQMAVDEIAMGQDQYSKQTMLSNLDKRFQGKDKRFVVALARNTHTWRVFPLPTRSHGLMSQHTIKEIAHIIGTFQLQVDGRHFSMHKFKFGRGAIYKGRYIPVFCVEIACWLLEASWQAYYSPLEYSLNDWAPGRMRLDSIGLKLEHAINDSETDTHAFVASNISEQVEGEEDTIIVVSFRGSASISNIKTDLSFRQVPLPEHIMSDVPAFNVRPGMPIAVDETLWYTEEHSYSGKYTPRPTTATESANVDPMDVDQSLLIPAVASGAKAIIRATPMARQALPCVHEGFLRNYKKVRHEIIEAIVTVMKRQLDKSVEQNRHVRSPSGEDEQPLTLPKLYITGHSMGGAMAQLLALDLASNCEIVIEQTTASGNKSPSLDGSGVPSKQSLSSLDNDDDASVTFSDTGDIFWLGQKLTQLPKTKKIHLRPPIAVYTYGQSRLGNNAFKTIYKRRVPHTFRVCMEGDAITTMPTLGPFCGGIYRHAGLEVLLEEGCTGNILVGPTVVETLFRFTKVRTSMAAHSMDRYRESLESALGRDDLKEYYRGHGGKVRHDNQGVYSSNGERLPSWVIR